MAFFSVQLCEHRTYEVKLMATSKDAAMQELRMRVASREIEPSTIDVEAEASSIAYCAECDDSHFEPVCPRPVATIRPSWERVNL